MKARKRKIGVRLSKTFPTVTSAGSGFNATACFKALANHYCFDPCFARVSEDDNGGVESRGKAIRLAHRTRVSVGDSLAALAHALQSDVHQF